jgi:FkbM family methyltransferase
MQAVLRASYYGEALFSKLQGIAFDAPQWNGEYRLIRTLGNLVKVAVDGGANRGDWTAEILSTVPTVERVLCVEPDERNCQQLRTRFTDRRVRVVEAALGAETGSAGFAAGADPGSGSGFLTARDDSAKLVQVTTLEQLARTASVQQIDLVKLDIEGEEISALHGAQELFQQKRLGTVQVEYNAPWLRTGRRLSELFEFAQEVNYTLLLLTPFGFSHTPVYGEGVEDYRMRNFALVRADHLSVLRPGAATGRFRVEAARAVQRT